MMPTAMHTTEDSLTRKSWMRSDEWVDNNILEWCRMRHDGLPYSERPMRRTHTQLKQMECTGEGYFRCMSIASPGLDPFNDHDRRKINPDHATHRAMTMRFDAKLVREIGEARFRERWTALFGGTL